MSKREISETYEQAVERTGRKWPYRREDWPCPACWKADCDLDIEIAWQGRRYGVLTFVYRHVTQAAIRKAGGE